MVLDDSGYGPKGMSQEPPPQGSSTFNERRVGDRRKTLRRAEDRTREHALQDKIRKLQSLLELGHLIGLDLQMDAMLLQIAEKAAEVLEADRCSLFLHDPVTDELWSRVALGLDGQVIRIPSYTGLAGHCFRTAEPINLEDAYQDPRFNRDVDRQTGYRTKSVLCMPMCNRDGQVLGVIQLLNRKEGVFTKEDEAFLEIFGNHASVFIEMAQLQKARMEALERSREELRRLNRAKDKALHHLSHELRTPLAVIQGTLRVLRRRLQDQAIGLDSDGLFETLDRHMERLLELQRETEAILRSSNEKIPPAVTLESVAVLPCIERAADKARRRAGHRQVHIRVTGRADLHALARPEILEEVLDGLLKNAVENTPDQGRIDVKTEVRDGRVVVEVRDYGVGILEENKGYVFDGLFPIQDVEQYCSKRPYDFNAGGKGLELMLMKTYAQRFGFHLGMESTRCVHIPSGSDQCPGRISECPHCRGAEDCLASGGSAFRVSLPASPDGGHAGDPSQAPSSPNQEP